MSHIDTFPGHALHGGGVSRTKGTRPLVLPRALEIQDSEFPAPTAADPLLVSVQLLPGAHLPKDLEHGQSVAVCPEGVYRAWT